MRWLREAGSPQEFGPTSSAFSWASSCPPDGTGTCRTLSWLPGDLQGWETVGPESLVGGLMVLGSSEDNLNMHLNGL